MARFTAQRFRFPGVEIKARLFRNYPLGEIGSHLIGYIGRINQAEKKAMEDWDEEDQANYRGTEYIGKLGVEQSYETELHGTTGFEEVETSAGGRAVRRLNEQPGRRPATRCVLSIDIKLQALVEELFGDRRGALVAIDPRNGEVLAFVSKPNFDPNLFVDGIDVENWQRAQRIDRQAAAEPGAARHLPAGLDLQAVHGDGGAATRGKRTPQQVDLRPRLLQVRQPHASAATRTTASAPVDMYAVDRQVEQRLLLLAGQRPRRRPDARAAWRRSASASMTGIDIDGEVRGVLPSTEWKRKAYKKPEMQKWYAGETISLGIGQGYNNFTMLQLAQATATLVVGRPALQAAPGAARSRTSVTRERKRVASDALPPLPCKPEHVDVDPQGDVRRDAGRHLGARRSSARRYKTGGKTGTAQAVGDQGRTRSTTPPSCDEHQRDHALYIAFAPLDAPTDRAGGDRRERRLRRRRRGADRAPRVRLRARWASTRARPTSPRRSSASRPRRSARRARATTVPLPGSPGDGSAASPPPLRPPVALPHAASAPWRRARRRATAVARTAAAAEA